MLALCLSLSLTQCLAFAPCVIFSGIKRSQRAARSVTDLPYSVVPASLACLPLLVGEFGTLKRSG